MIAKKQKKYNLLFLIPIFGLLISLLLPFFLNNNVTPAIIIQMLYMIFTYTIGFFMMIINYEGSSLSFTTDLIIGIFIFYFSIFSFFIVRYYYKHLKK